MKNDPVPSRSWQAAPRTTGEAGVQARAGLWPWLPVVCTLAMAAAVAALWRLVLVSG